MAPLPIRQTLSDDKDNPAFDIHICFEKEFWGRIYCLGLIFRSKYKIFIIQKDLLYLSQMTRMNQDSSDIKLKSPIWLEARTHLNRHLYFAWNFFCMIDKESNLVVKISILETDQLHSICSGLNLLLGTLTHLNFASDKNPFRE